ncbi:MAG: hypothetical protein JWM26_930 [Betaproteobacteria bacterium]|nr:hypothetical protein [Betaproteobacteria bacterium]
MLSDKSDDFWCPLGEQSHERPGKRISTTMTPAEWAALSRLALGEWLSDAQIARLLALGLVELAFGQALLTRLGRATLGTSE